MKNLTPYIQSFEAPKQKVGLYIDFENIYWGLKKNQNQDVIASELICKAEKYGQFALGYAVADWSERRRDGSLIYPERLKRDLRAAGIEAVDTPKSSSSDNKNLVDMKLAMLFFKTVLYRKDIDTHVLMSSDGIFVDVVNLIRQDFHSRVIIAGVPPISRELVNCVGEQHCDPLVGNRKIDSITKDDLKMLFLRRMADWEAEIFNGKFEYLGYRMLLNLLSKDVDFKFGDHHNAKKFLDEMIENSGIIQKYSYPKPNGSAIAYRLVRNQSVINGISNGFKAENFSEAELPEVGAYANLART